MSGYIYFLTNPAMPGLLKIGFTTTSLSQRLTELNTTGVPQEFIVGAAFYVTDPLGCEAAIHQRLAEYRLHHGREFFRLSTKQALALINELILARMESPVAESSTAADRAGRLDETDERILQLIIHSKGGEVWPQKVAWDLRTIHREEAHLRLGDLIEKGFLKERHESYSLTHQGRKYLFDHDLVISDLLQEPD